MELKLTIAQEPLNNTLDLRTAEWDSFSQCLASLLVLYIAFSFLVYIYRMHVYWVVLEAIRKVTWDGSHVSLKSLITTLAKTTDAHLKMLLRP